eukprot:5398983-Prymnesium_polylepis.2
MDSSHCKIEPDPVGRGTWTAGLAAAGELSLNWPFAPARAVRRVLLRAGATALLHKRAADGVESWPRLTNAPTAERRE